MFLQVRKTFWTHKLGIVVVTEFGQVPLGVYEPEVIVNPSLRMLLKRKGEGTTLPLETGFSV